MITPTIISGDCIDHCRNVIPPKSIHTIVSSPPYWGLRDYGIPGREWSDGTTSVYGNERHLSEYIAHTVELFEALGRVLRDDGVIWWNIGDTYGENGNRLLVPARVAIALQDAGWCIRQENIWAKKSPMPESVCGWFWQRCQIQTGKSSRAAAGSYHAEAHAKPHGERDGKNFASQSEKNDCPGCAKCEANGGYVLRRGKWRTTTGHEVIYQITKGQDYFCDFQKLISRRSRPNTMTLFP